MSEASPIWQERAQLLLRLRRPADAAQLAARQLTLDARNVTAQLTLAQALLAQNQLVRAAEVAAEAVHTDPEEPAAHYLLALALQYQGRHSAAEGPLATALRLNPYEPDYHGRRSVSFYHQKRLRQALAAADAGLAINPHHADCLLWRAMSCEALHRSAAADQAFATLLQLAPTDPVAHTNRGILLYYRENFAAARNHFHEALRFDPNLNLAQQYLKRLPDKGPPQAAPKIDLTLMPWWGWLGWVVSFIVLAGERLLRPAAGHALAFTGCAILALLAGLAVGYSLHLRLHARWPGTAGWLAALVGMLGLAEHQQQTGQPDHAMLLLRLAAALALLRTMYAHGQLKHLKQRVG
ncbi:tetratricopeptide repeat protein [Hymenobacter sp. B81]|uniref:tetratricopeptide repeat protein n=1 Tax=Hymenobacter sp. B81 TaxID=3344878 RepID=UPI0037DC9D59